jgi:hypothetical protein
MAAMADWKAFEIEQEFISGARLTKRKRNSRLDFNSSISSAFLDETSINHAKPTPK